MSKNVAIDLELHKKMKIKAAEKGISLSQLIEEILKKYLEVTK